MSATGGTAGVNTTNDLQSANGTYGPFSSSGNTGPVHYQDAVTSGDCNPQGRILEHRHTIDRDERELASRPDFPDRGYFPV